MEKKIHFCLHRHSFLLSLRYQMSVAQTQWCVTFPSSAGRLFAINRQKQNMSWLVKSHGDDDQTLAVFRKEKCSGQMIVVFSLFLVSLPVMDLVYWRSTRRTGLVFTGLVIGLASVFQLSIITVVSHVCLGALCVTFPLRLYYKLLELLRWNPGVHPFQSVNIDLPSSPLAFWWHTTNAAALFSAVDVCVGMCVCVCPQVISG